VHLTVLSDLRPNIRTNIQCISSDALAFAALFAVVTGVDPYTKVGGTTYRPTRNTLNLNPTELEINLYIHKH